MRAQCQKHHMGCLSCASKVFSMHDLCQRVALLQIANPTGGAKAGGLFMSDGIVRIQVAITTTTYPVKPFSSSSARAAVSGQAILHVHMQRACESAPYNFEIDIQSKPASEWDTRLSLNVRVCVEWWYSCEVVLLLPPVHI